MVRKQKQGTGEIPLSVDGDDTPGDTVPTRHRLRAELFLHGYGISAKDHVPDRYAVSRIEVDDLVARRDGSPEHFEIAFGRHFLSPASPLEVVVDDVQFALFAEPGGEEIFEHKTAYHAESLVEQIDDLPLGDSEPFQYHLKMFGEHLLAIRRPFIFFRPFDEVADCLICAGNTHVEVLRIAVVSSASWSPE